MNKPILLAFALVFSMCLTSCSSASNSETAQGKDFLVTIKTDFGDMKAILYDGTPQHKANFIKLAKEGFYDSLLFHRVMQGFMIQGGDPNSKNATPEARLGSGSPGYTIPAEINNQYFHKKGALAAARQNDQVNPERASNGSQFYIVHGAMIPESDSINLKALSEAVRKLNREQPEGPINTELQQVLSSGNGQAYLDKAIEMTDEIEAATGAVIRYPEERKKAYTTVGGTPILDGEYTVFGQVIAGLDVIDKIAAVQVRPDNRPLENIRMYISGEEMSKKDIEKKYGYTYQ